MIRRRFSLPKFERFNKKKRFAPPSSDGKESGRNWVSPLSEEETQKVKTHFAEKFGVDDSYWSDKVLFKKVHSVWICSQKAWEVQQHVRAKSVGLMLISELATLKTGKQAEYLFGSMLPLQKPEEN